MMGPNSIHDIRCLCPYHYAQFEAFTFYIEANNFEIVGLEGDKDKKIKVSARHKIDRPFLNYHMGLCLDVIT